MNQSSLILICLLQMVFSSCSQEAIPECSHLENTLTDQYAFPIGVAINTNELQSNFAYQTIVNEQFNSFTPENIFKPTYLQPVQGQFSWQEADDLINYSRENNKRFHGHTLIWHSQLPVWMNSFQGSSEDWDNMMKTHIDSVVRHFQGKVESWDVVNEAFEDDGSLRDNIWLRNIGETYIEKAFQYAHEADSNAKLFYNDYSLVSESKKREAAIDLMNQIREKGIPVHGIGMQMHIYDNFPSNKAISKSIQEIWENDYLVHISELDVSINLLSRKMETPSEKKLIKQAERYAFVFETYQEIPVEFQHGISIWGVSDRDSWIPGFFSRDDFPLLFDHEYEPKAAYCRLIGE